MDQPIIRLEDEGHARRVHGLADLKGAWSCDSYARFEHPNCLHKQIDPILDLYGLTLTELRILDVGASASSYCLVETLEPASFDVVWLQAVVEHLLPDERRSSLRPFWRALRPGAWLVVTETPNRLWPYETHTSGGRWFLPWPPAERMFATMRRQAACAAQSDVELYRSGIVGSTYGELLDCLGRPADCAEPARALRRTVVSALGCSSRASGGSSTVPSWRSRRT